MKGKRNLIVGLILGGLIGWASGFLRLPFLDKNFSFLIGFLACLALVALGLMIVFVWNKNAFLIRLIGKDPTTKDSGNAPKTYTLVWVMVSLFIITGGLISSFLIFNQNRLFQSQTEHQNKKISQQSELIESVRKGNLVFLMSNILDKVDEELNSTKGMLSNATIARIAALSYSFKPYRYLEGDSLSDERLSPERGQLLLALSIMNIDSISFNKIKRKTPFSSADLSGADLRGMGLSEADLKGANLSEADLRRAKLNKADLRGANFWAANLNGAELKEADLKRADLGWAELNETDMRGGDLNGADLTSAKLRKADMRRATFKWADLSGAFFNEADLDGADLDGADLRMANLSGANLNQANLKHANLSGANLSETNLTGVNLVNVKIEEENWLENLNEWQVTGAKEIQEKYKVVVNNSGESNYRLEEIVD